MMDSTDFSDPPAEKKPKEEASTTILLPTAPGFTPPTPNSKNQLKKQRKLAQFAELRKVKRRQEKERQKQKRRDAAEKGLPLHSGPSRKELKKKQQAVRDSDNALRVVIDLDCDDLMIERDVAKCVKQCLRIYTVNRRSECPVQLHLTGIKSEGNIHKSLKKNDGWENWHLNYHFDETHLQAFDNKDLIYLTSESDTVLDKLNAENIYVIGGLVDHNHHKNYCHDRATKAGLRTARLPLGEYVDMKTRAVLTTFHVFEILLRVAEGKCWSDAILQTIPPRKGAKLKENTGSKEVTNGGEDKKDVKSYKDGENVEDNNNSDNEEDANVYENEEIYSKDGESTKGLSNYEDANFNENGEEERSPENGKKTEELCSVDIEPQDISVESES